MPIALAVDPNDAIGRDVQMVWSIASLNDVIFHFARMDRCLDRNPTVIAPKPLPDFDKHEVQSNCEVCESGFDLVARAGILAL